MVGLMQNEQKHIIYMVSTSSLLPPQQCTGLWMDWKDASCVSSACCSTKIEAENSAGGIFHYPSVSFTEGFSFYITGKMCRLPRCLLMCRYTEDCIPTTKDLRHSPPETFEHQCTFAASEDNFHPQHFLKHLFVCHDQWMKHNTSNPESNGLIYSS